MKNVVSIISAGIVGGLIAVFAFSYINPQQSQQPDFNQSPRAVLTASADATPAFNFVEASEKVTPAVVHIQVEGTRALTQQPKQRQNDPFGWFDFHDFFGQEMYPKRGDGSGVIVSEDGYIVTNNHVVDGGDIIEVSVGEKQYAAKVIGTDPSTDLALIKIEESGLPYVEFADSDDVQVGEWVVAIGNPFSYLKSTVTAGIVSAKGRDINILKGPLAIEEFIQTDAAINPGNSGGALVNPEGKLVGINTAIATPTGVYAGYSFAIPSNLVKKIIDDIKINGNIERGRLGVEGLTVTEDIKAENNLNINYGFIVKNVLKGSGAQYAGVLPGDVIIEANGKSINNFDDLYEIIEFAKVGETINLVVMRRNKEIEIPVYLRKGI